MSGVGDPFGSMVQFCQISSSQELTPDPTPTPTSIDDDSQKSETHQLLRVEPTGICLASPPTNGGSQDKFETPPEEAIPAPSSEERWFGCEDKTVDLAGDTDLGLGLGLSESQKSEPGGGLKLRKVEIVEDQWDEFVKWQKKMAFRERLLEEQPPVKPVATDLKKPVESLEMGNQVSVKSNECTNSVGLDSEVNVTTQVVSPVSGGKDRVSEVGLDSEVNVTTQVVSPVSGGKDWVSEVGLGTNECTQALDLGSGGRSRVADAGMHKNLVVDAGMDGNVVEPNDHTEAVSLGSGGKILVSDQGIAKDHMEANSSTQVIMLDSEDNDMVLDEDTLKPGMALDGSTEEIVPDSDDGCLVTNEVTAKQGLATNVSTQVVEDEGLVLGADVAKKKPALSCGNEKVDNTPNVGNSKKSMRSGTGMGGLKNIEDIEKFKYVSPSESNSKQTPKVERVLPSSMHAPGKEGDSGKDPSTHLLSFALKKLPKIDPDATFESLSLKDIAKRRGVTFPKPSWWVKEDDEG